MKSHRVGWVGCLAWSVVLLGTLAVTAVAQDGPPPEGDVQTLIPAGAAWRYLDDGSNAGEAWRLPDFADANWNSGPAQLGYGDGDEATLVSFGPDAAARHITTYFRRTFEVANASQIDHLILRLVRDDGAVVYLNGQEIVRDNMPPGPISHETLAASTAGADENQFRRFDLSGAFLMTGPNVLAVEVHQVNPSSSDLSFDLELAGVFGHGEPLPVVSIQATVPETIEPSPTTRVQPGEFTITRSGSTNEPLILSLSFAGTAVAGQDYAEIAQIHMLAPGETILRVVVAALDDAVVEDDETVVVALEIPIINSLPNYQIDPARREARVIIHDNDRTDLPVVSIHGSPSVPEYCPPNWDCASLGFVLRRTGPGLDQPLRVFLRYEGTATYGVDYTPLPEAMTFEAGQELISAHAVPINDEMVEGDETVISRIAESSLNGLISYRIAPDAGAVTATILDDDRDELPVVSVVASSWRTAEPCPTCLVAPGVLVFRRTGSTLEPLTIWLEADGTATPGEDYEPLPNLITIPAGKPELEVLLLPRDDARVEGPEVVRVRLVYPLTDGPPTYRIGDFVDEAMVVIFDDEQGAPLARLDIIEPDEEDPPFPAGVRIPITAIGVYTENEILRPVQFYAGDTFIGQSNHAPSTRPPIAGLPSVHTIVWTNPPPGTHILTARNELSWNHWVTSPPVRITIGFDIPPRTWVSMSAEDAVATEMDLTPAINPARFRITRTGDLTRDLLVFYSIHGSAAAGDDYAEVASPALIPAGESSVLIDILAQYDDLEEGMETVVMRLEPSLLMGPLPTYEIVPGAGDAVAVILDRGFDSTPAVEIVWPEDGDEFTLPTSIEIVAAAYHLTRDMSLVDFYAGDRKIGESQIVFDRAFSGGLIVHRFTWTEPIPGVHKLTARAFADSREDQVKATSAPVEIHIGPEVQVPLVSIEATHPIAEESSDPFLRPLLSGAFTVRRTGPTTWSLPVFVGYSGLATPGVDTPELPWLVMIPEGQSSTVVSVQARPDDVPEGIETLVATIDNCPPGGMEIACSGFEVDPAHASATVFLRDDGMTEASLRITRPAEGAAFELGESIVIEAVAIDLNGYLSSVEFWAGDERIGVSEIFFIRAPDPGTPIHHEFAWSGASAGAHTLTVRVPRADGTLLRSEPVHIRVGSASPLPLVRIEATQPIAEETSAPLRRIRFDGEFTISRTGPTTQPLSVFVHYSGMATAGADYPHLPWGVTIPAGESSIIIRVEATPDDAIEGLETLVAALAHCPPDTDPPMGMPCFAGFEIEPGHEQATVWIRDDGITLASVRILRPRDGAEFRFGQTIPIEAIAIDLDSYISRVEFLDGTAVIGESLINFFVAPEPGTPIQHWLEWRDAAPGPHVLTARAERDDGTPVQSPPVHISVGPAVSEPPRLTIIKPLNGAQFPPNEAVEIVVEASDPDGYVPRVEFFANGRKLGERKLEFLHPPDPGEIQRFSFLWRLALPGPQVLTARATADDGGTAWSGPVTIQVVIPDLLPIVRVTARDPFAVEPGANTDLNTAWFRIRRFGPATEELTVQYSLHGTAENGTDYELLSGQARIAAGERSVPVIVRPLADELPEGVETVILRLEDPPGEQPPTYRVGVQRRAMALIVDRRAMHGSGESRCLRLPGGLLHLCFDAASGMNFRIECSTDLRNWETLFDTPAVEGVFHFVDDASEVPTHRFYRLTPEPVVESDE